MEGPAAGTGGDAWLRDVLPALAQYDAAHVGLADAVGDRKVLLPLACGVAFSDSTNVLSTEPGITLPFAPGHGPVSVLVVAVVLSAAPAKVTQAIVSPASCSVAALLSFTGHPAEGHQDKNVNGPATNVTEAAQVNPEVTVPVRERGERHSSAPANSGPMAYASHVPGITDFVEAFVTGHGQPTLSVVGARVLHTENPTRLTGEVMP